MSACLAGSVLLAACTDGAESDLQTTTTDLQTTTSTTRPEVGSTTVGETGTQPSTTEREEDPIPRLHMSVADGWTATSLGQGVKPVIDLDPSGTPAVAWILERTSGFVAYANAQDDWAVETVDRGYFYGPIDLDFSPEGRPNIVIHDHQAADFDPALGDLTRFEKRDGVWATDIARDRGHDGWDSALEIDDSGVIHAVGVDPEQFGATEGVEYYRKDGDNWEITQIGSGPVPYQYNLGLALDEGGSPAISYYDATDQALVFAQLVDGSWALESVAVEGDVGKYSSLSYSNEGHPAISFFNQISETSGEILFAVRSEDGWSIEVVGELEAFSERNARRNSSLAFDSANVAHIAFSDESGVWYAARGDAGWETQQIVTGELPLGQLVSLVFDSADRPHLTLYEVTDSDPLDGTIAYITPAE